MIHLANVALSIITTAVGFEFLIWLLVIGFVYMQYKHMEKFWSFISVPVEKQQQ